jgi:hypothetical protein
VNLVPLAGGLDVHAADVLEAFANQIADQMAADESAAATNDN